MLGSTHLLFGMATLAAAEVTVQTVSGGSLWQPASAGNGALLEPALGLAAVLLGSLAPDLDAEDSTIQRELGVCGQLTALGLKLIGVKHRGILHSGLALLFVTGVAVGLGLRLGYPSTGLAFGLGYASHVVLADALTCTGVPLWWPARLHFHLLPGWLRVRTGGPAEKLVALLVIALLVVLLPQAVPPSWLTLARRWR